MPRTRIKFCGITRPQDAVAAVEAGADAIGLVFHPQSPRYLSMERAAEILAEVPALVTPVGLFVDRTADQVREVAIRLGLRHVQLHGNETPETVAALRPLRVIKAVRVENEKLSAALQHWRKARSALQLTNLAALLLETAATSPDGASGGTGIENDWTAIAAAQAAGAYNDLPPIFLAGGLTPQNVGALVRQLRPYAVDVSSGIESSKGIKSVEKMNAFASGVALADSTA